MTIPFMYGHIKPGQDAYRVVVYTVAVAAHPRPAERYLWIPEERNLVREK